MDKKVKIILGLLGVLVVMIAVAMTSFSQGLMGYLQFPGTEGSESNVPNNVDVVDVAEDGILNTQFSSNVPGIVRSKPDLLDDFFYIDRFDLGAAVPESEYEPYDLPGVVQLVDRNFEEVFGGGGGGVVFDKTYKVAVAFVDFDYEGESYVFSDEEQVVLSNLKSSLADAFSYATDYQVGMDVSYDVQRVSVPAEYGFDVKYNWMAGETATIVSKLFYESNSDDFDFVFFFGKQNDGLNRFIPVQEEATGKGCNNSYGFEVKDDPKCGECFDYSIDFGSAGRLKGVVLMSVGMNGVNEPLKDPSTCALGMMAGVDRSMMSDVHDVYNDYVACDSAFAVLDEKAGAPYWLVAQMLHEFEHYWGLQVFPYGDDLFFENLINFSEEDRDLLLNFESFAGHNHFRYAVEGAQSTDPLGAVQYEWVIDEESADGLAKVCLQDLYPYQPLKFHPMIMHFMGVDEGVEMGKVFSAVNVFGGEIGAEGGAGGMELVKWEKDCVYLKPTSQSRQGAVSMQDVQDFWGSVEMCR